MIIVFKGTEIQELKRVANRIHNEVKPLIKKAEERNVVLGVKQALSVLSNRVIPNLLKDIHDLDSKKRHDTNGWQNIFDNLSYVMDHAGDLVIFVKQEKRKEPRMYDLLKPLFAELLMMDDLISDIINRAMAEDIRFIKNLNKNRNNLKWLRGKMAA